MTGIVFFAHGSSVASANQAVENVARRAAHDGGFALFETAFLDQASPTLRESVATLVGRGASEILVIPYFLTLGIHLQRDLPAIIDAISKNHDGVPIRVTPPLDGHPALSAILVERAHDALRTPAVKT